MKLSTKLPALIVLVTGVAALFAVSVLCTTSGETVQQFAPIPQATAQIALDRREQEAQVTATYIAVLSSEIVSDTMNAHRIAREREQGRFERAEAVEGVVSTGQQVLTWLGVISLGMVSISGGFWLGARGVAAGVKHVAEVQIPPSRRLSDGTNILRLPSGEIRVIETRAGGKVWNITDDMPADEIAARDVREFQFAVVKALAGAFVEQGGIKLLMGGKQCES